jgi:hypothetical protein
MSFATLLVSLLVTPPLADQKNALVLDTEEAKRIEAVLTYDLRYEHLQANEWIIVAAQAPSLPGQAKVKCTMHPKAVVVSELSSLHRPILIARVPARTSSLTKGISIQVTYEASLRSRRLRPLQDGEEPPIVPGLTDKERKASLLDGGHYDFKTGVFQQWLEAKSLHRSAGEGDLEFAFRTFRSIQSTCQYDYRPELDRHASVVCRDGRSDCGGLSTLFVSTLRANGIPARSLVGRWAQSARPREMPSGLAYYQAHVKAEFFATNVGWVPVDISSAVTAGAPQASLRYFGNDPGNFLTMHVDPDLKVDTIHFGRQQFPVLQGIAYWVTGRGSTGLTVAENWRVKELP